jgi:hypothetical protein
MPRGTWLKALVAVLAAGPACAQTVVVSKLDEATYRSAVTVERRAIFAANLALGPDELLRFWEIYDAYVKEREPFEKERFSLLQRIAQSQGTLSDDQAMALALASGRLQLSEVQLRIKYADALKKKMSGKVAARFFQIDDYVTTASRMNLLSGIPLVTPR